MSVTVCMSIHTECDIPMCCVFLQTNIVSHLSQYFFPKHRPLFAKMLSHRTKTSDESDAAAYKNFNSEYKQLVNLANKEFGINCWSHCITRQEIDCIDYSEGAYSVAVAAFVRVQLKSGIFHEELGYGTSYGLNSKIISISNARKESALDGLRRAIYTFGEMINGKEKPSAVERTYDKDQLPKSKESTSIELGRLPPSTNEFPLQEGVKQNMSPGKIAPILKQKSCNSPMAWRKQQPLVSSTLEVEASVSSDTKLNQIKTSDANLSIRNIQLSNVCEDNELKLERKRKQRQKQEEFRQRLKKNKARVTPTAQNENSSMSEWTGELDLEETLISTQELETMVQSCNAGRTTHGPPQRAPLLSSPPTDGPSFTWGHSNKARKMGPNGMKVK